MAGAGAGAEAVAGAAAGAKIMDKCGAEKEPETKKIIFCSATPHERLSFMMRFSYFRTSLNFSKIFKSY